MSEVARRIKALEEKTGFLNQEINVEITILGEDEASVSASNKELEALKKQVGNVKVSVTMGEYIEENN